MEFGGIVSHSRPGYKTAENKRQTTATTATATTTTTTTTNWWFSYNWILAMFLPRLGQCPTPISALIHAATMVTAGVYLIARTHPLFLLSESAMLAVAIIGVLTLLISFYLIYISWDILVSSLKILMLFAPEHIHIDKVVKELNKIKGIRNIHHVHIWQLNEHDCHFEAHIEFKNDIKLSDFDVVCEEIEHILKEKFNINHSNLQPEYYRNDEKEIIIQD